MYIHGESWREGGREREREREGGREGGGERGREERREGGGVLIERLHCTILYVRCCGSSDITIMSEVKELCEAIDCWLLWRC